MPGGAVFPSAAQATLPFKAGKNHGPWIRNPGPWLKGSLQVRALRQAGYFAACLRRAISPTSPKPSRAIVAGSGVVGV